MAGTASDYHRGEMDISEQTATYHLVMALTKWGSLAISAFVLFITLLFCTKAGFIGSAITALVLVAAGIIALREKKSAAH